MNDRQRRELLGDILNEAGFEPFNCSARARAMQAFERRHQLRRLRPLAGACLAALFSVILALTQLPHRSKRLDHALAGVNAPREGQRNGPFLISEQELLSYFPPNSCSLVETDGKSILVFWNEEVRKRFFPESNTKVGLKPGA